jgi:type I restriction enzyme S subunit
MTFSEDEIEYKSLKKGDLLVCEGGDIGRSAVWEGQVEKCGFQNHIHRLRPKSTDVVPAFFMYYLQAGFTQLGIYEGAGNKTTIPNLSRGRLAALEVAKPSKPEQEKIAAALWKVQRAIEIENKLVAAARELKLSTMHQLFTSGLRRELQKETPFGPVPKNWEIRPLVEWAFVQGGATKGRIIRLEDSIEVPYLRVANVQDGRLDLNEIKTIRIRRDELESYRLQKDDVVLTEGGDFDKLGRGFIWECQIDPCIHQNHIFAVRVNRSRLWPRYFAYLAQSPYGKAYFLTVAHKTTNLACINTTKLRAFPVLRPELDEQKEIATILQTIDRKISIHERKRAALSDLFQTLLHELMTGQIRVDELDIDTSEVKNVAGKPESELLS